MKECEIKNDGGIIEAKIKCEIDHHTAKNIREAIDRELSKGKTKILKLDFSLVTFMDSSGIGLILGRTAKAEAIGATVEVVGLTGRLRRLVCMSGMEKIPTVKIK